MRSNRYFGRIGGLLGNVGIDGDVGYRSGLCCGCYIRIRLRRCRRLRLGLGLYLGLFTHVCGGDQNVISRIFRSAAVEDEERIAEGGWITTTAAGVAVVLVVEG